MPSNLAAVSGFLIATLATSARAQVPDGSYVTASFQVGTFGGPAGIYIADRSTGAVTPVTGLPPEITGAAYPSAVVVGCDLVMRRPRDGVLITTGFGSGISSVQMPVFLLTLNGSAVVNTVRYDIGMILGTGLGVTQAHVLADDRIVLAVDQLGATGEPLNGAVLGMVDPRIPNNSPGAVVAVLVTPVPAGAANGMAVDENAAVVYLGMIQTNQPSAIYAVPLTGGTPQLVTTVAETITNMAVVPGGEVIVVCSGSGGIYRVDPLLGTATPFTNLTNFNGVAVERASGDLIVATGAPGPILRRVDPLGNVTTIATAPSGGWGTLAGVDVNHDPEPYGDPTPGANTYRWRTDNGGGVPQIGNAAFRIEVTAEPAAPVLTGIVATGTSAPAPLTVLGMAIVVDPTTLLVNFVGPGATAFVQPLPLPNDPGLVGVQFFFQSFHVEANSLLASSGGLALTILP